MSHLATWVHELGCWCERVGCTEPVAHLRLNPRWGCVVGEHNVTLTWAFVHSAADRSRSLPEVHTCGKISTFLAEMMIEEFCFFHKASGAAPLMGVASQRP